jgi:hypothetical protein
METASQRRLSARLSPGEQVLFWGLRIVVQHRRCGRPAMAAILQVYRQFGVDDALASLDTLIDAISHTAHTSFKIHGSCCPSVSQSELLLLQAVAAAQTGDLEVARSGFEQWLPELAADSVLGPACGLGQLFCRLD